MKRYDGKIRFYDDPKGQNPICSFCAKRTEKFAIPPWCKEYPDGIPRKMFGVFEASEAECFIPEK